MVFVLSCNTTALSIVFVLSCIATDLSRVAGYSVIQIVYQAWFYSICNPNRSLYDFTI
jgi:hypothetical protein